jgi:hypothetical protein
VTFHAVLTLCTIIAVIVLLIRDRIMPALIVFGADVLLMVTGVLSPAQALDGIGEPCYPVDTELASGGTSQGILDPLATLATGLDEQHGDGAGTHRRTR